MRLNIQIYFNIEHQIRSLRYNCRSIEIMEFSGRFIQPWHSKNIITYYDYQNFIDFNNKIFVQRV